MTDTQVVIAMPVTEHLEADQSIIVQRANEFVVDDALSYQNGWEMLKVLKRAERDVDDLVGGAVTKAHEAHLATKEIENRLKKPIKKARAVLNGKVSTWKLEQERRDREERDRLAAIERKKQDDIREAEALRIAELAKAAPTEERKEELIEQAVAVIDEPLDPVNVMVPRTAPKIQGGNIRTKPDFEIVDPQRINREFLIPDETKIRKTVTALGHQAQAVVGGISVFDKPIVTTRA